MTADTITPEADQQTAPQLTDEERRLLVEQAIERGDKIVESKIVESEIDIARLFVTTGKVDVARRRLQQVIERFPDSEAVQQAREMLESLV